MSNDSNSDVEVFTEALRLPPGERPAFLQAACGNDTQMLDRVKALLRTHEQLGGFLEFPAPNTPLKDRARNSVGEKPGDRIGHYKLLQQIGEGGCGVVFMAEQEEPVRRRVALKIIKPGMDTKSVIARFEAERQALALMDHPNIAKVFDAGATESGRPYFVMELVRGVKITDYCDQNSLTTEERLKLFVLVCQAVQHAHQKGMIHRDIKPSNILVGSSLDGAPSPVVIDFGIAKATTNQPLTNKTLFTAFEMLIGTPAYMSPEQAELSRVDVDTRTDIYSLGVLLYELLTGLTPFDTSELLKAGLDEVRRVIREQEPPRPSTKLSGMTDADLTTVAQHRKSEPPRLIRAISGDLDWIVMKTLDKDRTRRYETANGLAVDVQRFLANETISARPPSKFYKLQKLVLRNKVLFTAISLVSVLIVTGLIIVSASLAREHRARQEADSDKQKAQQVTQFLEDMLQGVGPSVALGRDTTLLREILDKAAARVSSELTNQPAVEAELRSRIGNVYGELALFDQAEAMHRSALALYKTLYGEQNANTATSLNSLALLLRQKGKLAEAETAFRSALDTRRLLGNSDAEVAATLNGLSVVLRQQGKLVEAETLARESLLIRRKLLNEPNLAIAESLDSLGVVLRMQGKGADAEVMGRQALEMRRKLLDPGHPLIAVSLANLGLALELNKKSSEAEDCYRDALTIQSKLLGTEHLNAAVGLSDFAAYYRKENRLADAETMLRYALSVEGKYVAQEHPDYISTYRKLGSTLKAEGKISEAESANREVLKLTRKVFGDGHEDVAASLKYLVDVLLEQKKYAKAEQEFASLLTPDFATKPESARALAVRGNYLARRGRWKEAAADFQRVVKYRPHSHLYYHMLAPVLAELRDTSGHQQLCSDILSEFAATTDPYAADRMAKDCLIVPAAGIDLTRVDQMAQTAVNATNEPALPYFQCCKALAQYRQGRFESAIEWAQKPLIGSKDVYVQIEAYPILAMAHAQLKHDDEAKAALTKGNEILSRELLPRGSDDLGNDWQGWVFGQVLMDEAAQLIQGTSNQ